MYDSAAMCQICRSNTRPVRYVSHRIQICQWCVSFLCKKPVDPDAVTDSIYDYAQRCAAHQFQKEIDSKVPSRATIKDEVFKRHSNHLIANTLWNRLFKLDELNAQQARLIEETDAKYKEAIELATPSDKEEVLSDIYNKILADIVARQTIPVFLKNKILFSKSYYMKYPREVTCKETATPTQLKYFNSIFYHMVAGNAKSKRLSIDEWHDVKTEIRKKDGNKCCICGAKPSNTILHVHHIIPLSKYGSNHPNNLITLCECCHQKAHPDIEGIKTLKKIRKTNKAILRPRIIRSKVKPEAIKPAFKPAFKQETFKQTQVSLALKKLIILHGLDVVENPAALRHHLQETCLESEFDIDVIVLAADKNIPRRLLISNQSYSITVGRLAVDLCSKLNLCYELTEWAVKSWGAALGIEGGSNLDNTPLYQLLLDAKALESKGESEEAIGVYTTILEAIPTSLAALTERGRLFFLLGDYNKAILDFDSVLAIRATDHTTLFYRGRAFDLLGNKAQAIEDYEDVLLASPNNAIVLNFKGLAHSYLAESEDAVESYIKAIEISTSPILYLNLGYEFFLQEKHEEALRNFNSAISLEPTLQGGYRKRGLVYFALGRTSCAIADFTKCLELDPTDGLSFRYRGDVYDSQGDSIRALSDFNNALRVDPENYLGYFKRGWLYYRLAEYEKGLTDLNVAIQLQVENVDLYMLRGRLQASLYNTSEAIDDFTKVLSADKNNCEALLYRGWQFFTIKEFLLSIKDFRHALSLEPNNISAKNKLAASLLGVGDHEKAVDLFEEIIEISTNSFELGFACYYLKKYEDAYNYICCEIEFNSKNSDVYFLKGLINTRLKNYNEALADFGNCILQSPKCHRAFFNCGVILFLCKRFDCAIINLSDAIALNDRCADSYLLRGFIHSLLQNKNMADDDFNRAVSINPKYREVCSNVELVTFTQLSAISTRFI